MTLKKTIATKEGGYDVEMHPLEENETRAYWAIHDVRVRVPGKPTPEQEMDLLLEHGAEHVKKVRKDYKDALDVVIIDLDKAHDVFYTHHNIWCAHVEHCVAHGLDKDTHDKDKHNVIEKF